MSREWTEDQAGVPHVPLEAPPSFKSSYGMCIADLLSAEPAREPKGKDHDGGADDRSSKKEEKGASCEQEEQEEDGQSTIEEKRKIQRNLLEEMLPLLRLWAMPCEMLQHIEKLPALAGVPGMA
jgi:hypothetical protein